MKEKLKINLKLFADNALHLVALSIITGLFAGVVVTFYNILMSLGEDVSASLYALLRENPAYIPLLFLGLCAGAVVIGTLVKFVPMIRGSGIPQIEGAARGIVRFKWYVTMCSMFAASLACVFLGYAAGAEGPSLEIGGCAGSATATLLRRNAMHRRLQTASGASAGLAVAFNAPITGVVFALEEAFRSFSPQVFICSAISVGVAVLTRNAIRAPLGFSTGFSFNDIFIFNFSFDGSGAVFCLWVLLAAVIVSIFGAAFYYAVFALKRLFKRITFLKGTGKYMIPFVVAGAFALISAYSIGGGHGFIQDLATHGGQSGMSLESVFGASVIASLVIIVILRFITGVMSMGCGVPCGVFIPMLAIGAGLGAILSLLFQSAGMDAKYSDYLVIICMAAFFTCIVKAPITGIVMVFELTGQFANFLPALIGIVTGLLLGKLFKTDSIYEKCLDMFIAEEKIYEKVKKVRLSLTVGENTRADGVAIRSIIWPANGLVIARTGLDGVDTVPDGETVLHAGESFIFECETDDEEELKKYLYTIVGEQEIQGE